MASKAWMCWSSGKDSAWALHTVRQQGELEVIGLLTTVTEAYGRVSMHGVREELLAAQADALGLPLYTVRIPAPCSNEVYQQQMRQAVDQARREGVTHMIFGDLYLQDVRSYRETQLAGTGITPVFPLWGRPTDELAREMIASGLVAHVTCLDPRKIDRSLAGARFDEHFLARLPAGTDPCAENGEFHTCVSAGPMFSRNIPVRLGQSVEREGFVFTDLELAR